MDKRRTDFIRRSVLIAAISFFYVLFFGKGMNAYAYYSIAWFEDGSSREVENLNIGTTDPIINDIVVLLQEDVYYESITIDKANKTAILKNVNNKNTASGDMGMGFVNIGGAKGWTYIFEGECGIIEKESFSGSFRLFVHNDCSIKANVSTELNICIDNNMTGLDKCHNVRLIDTVAYVKLFGQETAILSDVLDLSLCNHYISFRPKKDENIEGTEQIVDNNIYRVESNDKVTFIGTKSNASSLKIPQTVTIKDKTYTVTAIGKDALGDNTKLKKLVIPSSVTRIYKCAFDGCKNLKNITIDGNTLKTVDKYALYGINKKATITIKAKTKKRYNTIVKMLKNRTDSKKIKYKWVKG